MSITVITIAAVILAFLAGAAAMRNKAAKDMAKVARLAADQQEESSSNFYWALHVINGVAFNEKNELEPHKYPARKVAQAKEILKSMGVLDE